MKKFRFKPSKGDWAIVVVLCFIAVYLANRWINFQISQLPENYNLTYSEKMNYLKDRLFRKKRYFAKGDVLRREKLEPNRKFAESRFLKEGEEIARFRSLGEKIYEIKGEIPDGKMKFINESKKTTGFEWYRDGKRHGRYKEFYDNGGIYRESQYYRGKLMTDKVYYYDGSLRMEVDRRDALIAIDDIEAGQGRVYFRDGKIMYEWQLTNALDGGHKTSYNKEGDLTEIKYYNTLGRVTEVKKF